MDQKDAIAQLDERIKRVAPAVGSLEQEIQTMIDTRIEMLVSQNDEGARGGIKALRELLELPATLQSERSQLEAGLPQEDPDFS